MALSRPLEVRHVDRGGSVGLPAPAFDTDRSVLVTFGFRCNLACTFCMVEDVLDHYRGASLETMRERLRDPAFMRGASRVVLSGGEATLEDDLADYVRAARELPQVRHVRVQTNGTRLANKAYLYSLLEAGVTEFFVSLHGHDEETCDALTQRKGSFRAILAGMAAIAESGAALYTNTVIWSRSHRHLQDVVALVAPYAPSGMEFWNVWPRVDPHDERGHLVPVAESAPYLRAALKDALARGIPPRVKFYPRCLLGEYGPLLDDSQPNVLVEATYWEAAPRYACIHQESCRHAPSACSGLSHGYVRKFGWEESLLVPEPLTPDEAEERRRRPPRSPAEASMMALDGWVEGGGMGGGQTEAVRAFCAALGLEKGNDLAGFQLDEPSVARGSVTLPLRRGDELVTAHLWPRDAARKVFARTERYDVTHGTVAPAFAPAVAAPLKALVERVRAREQDAPPFPAGNPSEEEPLRPAAAPTRREPPILPAATPVPPVPEHAGRSFVARAVGAADDADPAGLLQVLERTRALLAAHDPDAARRAELDLECSVRVSSQGLEGQRYLVQAPLSVLEPGAGRALSTLLTELEAPAAVLEDLARLGRTAGPTPLTPEQVHFIVGSDWHAEPARRTRRLYLEARGVPEQAWGELLGPGPDGATQTAVAWDWTPGKAGSARLRRYHELRSSRAGAEALRLLPGGEAEARFGEPLRRLLAKTRPLYAYRRTDAPDGDASSRAEAVQFIVEAVELERVDAELRALATAAGADADALGAWLERAAPALLRVVGLGRTRDGRWHVTPYLRAAWGRPAE